MTHKEIIDGLKFTMDMILFDPSTGEVKAKEQLNDLDRTTYDACEGAIEIIKNLSPDKTVTDKPVVINDTTTTDEIKVGDEFEWKICGGGLHILLNIDRGEYAMLDAEGNIGHASSLKYYKKTGRHFPQIAEIMKLTHWRKLDIHSPQIAEVLEQIKSK